MCVRPCVCYIIYYASCYIHVPHLYIENQVLRGFLCCFLRTWISIKTLCSKVLMTFADHLCLLCFLINSQWTKETVMASFQEYWCIGLAIVLTIRLTHRWLQWITNNLVIFLCVAKLLIDQAHMHMYMCMVILHIM